MPAEDFVSSVDVFLVTDDAGVDARVHQTRQTFDVLDGLKDLQRDPALAFVDRLLEVASFKEHVQVIGRDAEDVTVDSLRLLPVVA